MLSGSISDKSEERTILLLGSTSTGKSTFIDAICNYIFDTKWNEKTRFNLLKVPVPDSNMTTSIVIYTIYSGHHNQLPYTLNIIAAPAFTSYVRESLYHQLCTLGLLHCKAFKSINAICLCIKATETRLESEKDAIELIEHMLGVTAEYLIIIATFANPDKLPVCKVIDEAKIKYRNIVKIDNALLFTRNTKDDIVCLKDNITDKESFLETYWNMENDYEHFSTI